MKTDDERSTEYEAHEEWRASWRAFVGSPFVHWRELTGFALLFVCLTVFATAAGAEKATTQIFSGIALILTAWFLAFHDQRSRAQALQKRIDRLEEQVKTSRREGPRLAYQKGHLHVHGNSVTISLQYKNVGDEASEVGCWNIKIWWAELGDHPHYAEAVHTGAVRPNSNGEVVFDLGMTLPAETPVYVIATGIWLGAETKLVNHGMEHLKWAKSQTGERERTLSQMTDGERHTVSKYVVNKMKVSRHPRLEAIAGNTPESGQSQDGLRQIMETMIELHNGAVPEALRSKPSLTAR